MEMQEQLAHYASWAGKDQSYFREGSQRAANVEELMEEVLVWGFVLVWF